MASEDPIITVLRLVDEIEEDDPEELVRRFRKAHPDLDRQAFLDACTVALDIIDTRPKRLH
ncbi:hypothetical protein GCM10011390_15140 [Aureimonas endophytica]|uniref:Uncharacterized protein n=1 Tax=Aureimonas endophytica TaxID=2027858 RepID=A0A916ZGW3_9HYPH|nr:hypothetical protein [Aureimonas endophytica]GGD97317.1 hypothetical protein GCM10011390_15140 [Aureimonas endophytica]